MPTKILLTMPQPGETITQGTIVKWLATPGVSVAEGDHIVELETEKAVFEYESPYEGKLVEIVAGNGSVVAVGNPIAVFEVPDQKASMYFMLGIGKKAPDVTPATGKPLERGPKNGSPPKTAARGGDDRRLSPLIRNLMREYGIDLSELDKIRGTGPGGRVTKENIMAYLAERKGAPEVATSSSDIELIPLSPVRARIAQNMARSSESIPHAHTGLSIDLTNLLKKRRDESLLSLIFPSLKKAILQYPVVNASFRAEGVGKSIAIHKKIHLGVAVDVGKGLFLVVVRDAHQKDARTFERELKTLIEKGKEDRLSPADVTGMTFTFNNFGYYGTSMGVQIILAPQSATLGMGKIEERPWVIGGKVEIRQVADFIVAFDHRVLDGREASLFLSTLKKLLEAD